MLIEIKNNDLICINADSSELARLRDFVLSRAKAFGFDETTSTKIVLAVDEACTNLIEHSYKFDKSREICVKIDTNDGKFNIQIFDDGNSFDPLSKQKLDMNEYISNIRRGGLGIHIIRLVMDEIKYFPRSNNFPKNVLILTKYIQ